MPGAKGRVSPSLPRCCPPASPPPPTTPPPSSLPAPPCALHPASPPPPEKRYFSRIVLLFSFLNTLIASQKVKHSVTRAAGFIFRKFKRSYISSISESHSFGNHHIHPNASQTAPRRCWRWPAAAEVDGQTRASRARARNRPVAAGRDKRNEVSELRISLRV